MKQIPLTQSQYALVDDADYDWLSQWKWYALNMNGNFYAHRNSSKINSKSHLISMSRFILGLEKGDKRQGDHRNHNTLDNRRNNLRICTQQQNQRNRKTNSNTFSQYKGVSWNKHAKKWHAQITINGTRKHLGYFIEEKDAAEAYNIAALEKFGEFICLNH